MTFFRRQRFDNRNLLLSICTRLRLKTPPLLSAVLEQQLRPFATSRQCSVQNCHDHSRDIENLQRFKRQYFIRSTAGPAPTAGPEKSQAEKERLWCNERWKVNTANWKAAGMVSVKAHKNLEMKQTESFVKPDVAATRKLQKTERHLSCLPTLFCLETTTLPQQIFTEKSWYAISLLNRSLPRDLWKESWRRRWKQSSISAVWKT